ncbi:cation transporter [Tessaracoccus flavus]|uniref:cation transporter n=1 Tax=Tessaracoccus flavus TaxID=1610493 RepID=UPI001D03D2ED|nr:cation transporter [Tessaracoccus flavus]
MTSARAPSTLWPSFSLALRPPTPERTWGYRRAEVLAAGAQSAILLAVGIYAFIEGVRRLFDPAEVTAGGLLVFGIETPSHSALERSSHH